MLTGFDHITIAVSDLDRAIRSYQQLLGHAPVWRGEHRGLGSHAALFALQNSLIELVAPLPEAAEGEGLRSWLEARGEGLQAVAWASEDAAAVTRTLRERGLRATPPQPGEAVGEDGRVRDYQTVELSPRQTRGLSLLAVARSDALPFQDARAPELHALDHIVVRTSNIDAALALYQQALGLRLALDRTFGHVRMLFFRLGGVTLEVVQDASLGESDVFHGAAYRVRDIEAARARLSGQGLTLTDIRPGNKPGTRVFSVRDGTHGVPTLILFDPARG